MSRPGVEVADTWQYSLINSILHCATLMYKAQLEKVLFWDCTRYKDVNYRKATMCPIKGLVYHEETPVCQSLKHLRMRSVVENIVA